MTTFRKILVVNQEQLNWIQSWYDKLCFRYEPNENYCVTWYDEYITNYYWSYKSYHLEKSRKKEIKEIDEEILCQIQQDEDLEMDVETRKIYVEKFHEYVHLRNTLEEEIIRYAPKYQPLGFCVDCIPNFYIEIESLDKNLFECTFETGHEKHEHIHNPFLLGILFQKFMIQFNRTTHIKIPFTESAEELERPNFAGYIEVSQNNIEIFSLSDLEHDEER